jgi:hypothetical protein
MNQKQKSLRTGAAVLAFVCLVYNLWKMKAFSETKLAPIGYPNLGYLVIEWAAIAVVFAIFFFVFQTRNEKP